MNSSVLKKLKPWMSKPFQFLFHAETHYQSSSDYNKRMAFISFDNSIEVSICTFIHINKNPKGERLYKEKELEKEKKSFFGKLSVFEKYVKEKGLPIKWDKDNINYYHEQRNNLYHDATLSSPDTNELKEIRQISFWIFSILFDITNIEEILNSTLEEAEKEFPLIPEELIAPKIGGIQSEHENSLFIASILGGWDENSSNDNEIIKKLAREFDEWINDVREIKKYNEEIFSLKNGKWHVHDKNALLKKYSSFFYDFHLESIEKISMNILSEIHPKFELKPENRFASSIYGKIPKYSSELRKGICETLVFLGIHGKELFNCSLHKPEFTPAIVIRELLKEGNWELWASLNDLLPILAEAAPNEFLLAVEKALQQSPCPFDELFNQESKSGIMDANYMPDLYWALEALAWSEEYFSRVIYILAELANHDPGGKLINRPSNSISAILLPWLPKTMATVEKRIASLKSIQKEFPGITWKILIKLLPNQQQFSIDTHKPFYRKYIPEDWEKGVSNAEYWKQVNMYAAMAIDMAKGNILYISELVEKLNNIPFSSFDVFITYLSSNEIMTLSDQEKLPIWEALNVLVKKHRHFFDAKWALPKNIIDKIEKTANKLVPANPIFLYRHLFSNKDFEFFDKDTSWGEQQELLWNKRIEAIKQVYGINKIGSIIEFIEQVENSTKVGNAFAQISDNYVDNKLLPSFIKYSEKAKKDFISGYIWSRFQKEGISWIDDMCVKTWSIEQKCFLLNNVPFEEEIWNKACKLLGGNVEKYWKEVNVNPFLAQSNSLIAIENLLQFGRPFTALDCIFAYYYSKKKLLKNTAIKALISGITSSEDVKTIDSYHIVEVIKLLQADPEVSEDELFKIEWFYLPFLDKYNNAEPKILEKYLSQKPEFFIEIIQLIYRSKKETIKKKANKKTEQIVTNAWKLLHEWKRPPGKLDDSSFSEEVLLKWFEEVKEKSIESGHFEIAMSQIGHVLYYSNSDPSGLWIHKSVAKLLDDKDNNYIREGFSLEVHNSRGIHTVDPSGKPEKELAELWRKKAEDIELLGFIHFSSMLKEIAKSYDREAERTILEYSNENKD